MPDRRHAGHGRAAWAKTAACRHSLLTGSRRPDHGSVPQERGSAAWTTCCSNTRTRSVAKHQTCAATAQPLDLYWRWRPHPGAGGVGCSDRIGSLKIGPGRPVARTTRPRMNGPPNRNHASGPRDGRPTQGFWTLPSEVLQKGAPAVLRALRSERLTYLKKHSTAAWRARSGMEAIRAR